MNHMNFFNPFKNHDEWHEDVLTRNFLLLVKNIPLVQIAFLEEIRNAVKDNLDIPSPIYQQLKLTDIRTQVAYSDSLMENLEETNKKTVLQLERAGEEAFVEYCRRIVNSVFELFDD